ncbi:MAG: tetratricopeptide repeat protein, partial [Ktedonobacteraceae bacterium]
MSKSGSQPSARLRLVEARKRQGWSQQEMADHLGTTRLNVSRWERGITTPSPYFRIKLTALLKMNAHDLLQTETESEQTSQEEALPPDQALSAPGRRISSGAWTIPYPRNAFFTGREDLLHELHARLGRDHSLALTQAQALSGLGGIGKTQTAIEYAYRYANDYTAIFWISAETHESIVSSFVAIAEVLKLSEREEKEQSRVIAAVNGWLNSHRDWLLIFDNVEEIELVKGALPATRSGSVLFTTRRHAIGLSAQMVNLEKMTDEESLRFLLLRGRLLDPTTPLDQLTATDVALAREIARKMDGLPLALDQAGAYIEATQCSLSDYLQLLHMSQSRLLDERDAYADHPLSVTKTFALAFKQIEQDNALAAELLTLGAFLAPEAIPEALFVESAAVLGPPFEALTTGPLAFNAAIKELLIYSLIQRNATARTVTIHRLVQAVIKEGVMESAQRQWAIRAIRAVNHVFPDCYDVSAWPRCQSFLPHALACAALITSWNMTLPEAGELLYRAGNYLRRRGQYSQAEPLLCQALDLLMKMLGPEHLSIAQHLNDLALLYSSTGQWTRAEVLFQQSLTMREKKGGPDHPDTAESLQSLGYHYCEEGRYAEAEPLFRRTVQIYEQSRGPDHLNTASILSALGFIHNRREEYTHAESLLQRALLIQEKALGLEHLNLANTLNNLGYASLGQRCYSQAEAYHMRALAIREKALGPEHPDLALSLSNLGKVSFAQGRDQQAERSYQRALAIREKALGP